MKERMLMKTAPFWAGIAAAEVLGAVSSATAAPRVVLGEEFTATWCGPCVDAGLALGQLMDTYPLSFVLVQIHVADVYATAWGNARATFYGATAWPTSVFDGVDPKRLGAQLYSTYLADYNAKRAVVTDVTLSIGAQLVSEATYNVTATVGIESGGAGKTMRIQMVQLLDHWPPIPPPKPQYSRNGLKQAAAPQDITLAPGGTQFVTRTMTLDPESAGRLSDVRFVAWAQLPSTAWPAQVFQAAIRAWPFEPPLGDMDGDFLINMADVDDFVLALVDPAAYEAQHPDLDPMEQGDIDQDGLLNGLDIGPFILLLTSLGVDAVPTLAQVEDLCHSSAVGRCPIPAG